jgi:Hemopexin
VAKQDIFLLFQYNDHKTYFFKGPHFWEFDDLRMKVKDPNPTEIGHHWMHCPKPIKDPFKSIKTTNNAGSGEVETLTLIFCSLLHLRVARQT